MKKTITISVDLGDLKNSFKILEPNNQNNQNFDEKFIKEKIKQGKFEILKINNNEEEDIDGIYVNNDEQKKQNNNIKQLDKEKITNILNEKKIEIFISKKETLNSLRKILTDFKNFNFKKNDESIYSEKEEGVLKIEDIIKKNSNEPYIYLVEDDNKKEKSLPKRTKKNYILNEKVVEEADKNKLLSDLRKELKSDDNDFFMNDSKEINKLNEKDLKFSDIESDNNINIIIIKKKFEFEFIKEENNVKNVFFCR